MQLLPTNQLELVVLLSRQLENSYVDQGTIQCTLSEDYNFSFDQICAALSNLDLLSDSDKTLHTIDISVSGINFFKTFDHFLENPSRRIRNGIPPYFYIKSNDFLYDGNLALAPVIVNNFFDLTKLYEAIQSISDFSQMTSSGSESIFISKKRLIINTKFEQNKLSKINNLDKFINAYINDEVHIEHKRAIIRSVIFEKYIDPEISISRLAHDFDDFFKSVRNGYELYVGNFSFEEFKNAVEELRREYTLKINKVLTDIQNQVLAIPLATIIAAGQLKKVEDTTSFILNFTILFGIFFFSYILWVVIQNQQNSLTLLSDELDSKKIEFSKKKDTEYGQLSIGVFAALITRIASIEKNLKYLTFALIGATIITLAIFLIRFKF